jgi:hypothetical protein
VYLHRTKRKDTETHAHTETHAPDTEKTSQEQEEKYARLFQRLVDDAMKKSRGTLHEGPQLHHMLDATSLHAHKHRSHGERRLFPELTLMRLDQPSRVAKPNVGSIRGHGRPRWLKCVLLGMGEGLAS